MLMSTDEPGHEQGALRIQNHVGSGNDRFSRSDRRDGRSVKTHPARVENGRQFDPDHDGIADERRSSAHAIALSRANSTMSSAMSCGCVRVSVCPPAMV
jgi:hypothetical protein